MHQQLSKCNGKSTEVGFSQWEIQFKCVGILSKIKFDDYFNCCRCDVWHKNLNVWNEQVDTIFIITGRVIDFSMM